MMESEPAMPPSVEPASSSQPPPVPIVASDGQSPAHAFRYDGEGTPLFKLYLKNILLTILTLGVYQFWAKVAVQKFHYRHTEFFEGRFGYHATGKEKFVGFLKGMLVLSPLIGGSAALYFWFREDMAEANALFISIYAFAFAFAFLRPLVMVGARRFNLARTSWSNLRFRFAGTVGDAYRLYLKDYFLIAITFGIYYSWHLVNVQRFKFEHTRFGSARFDYTGRGGELFATNVVGVICSYITLGIFLPWYLASLFRFHTGNTRMEGIWFGCSLTGWQVMKMFLTSLVLIVCTLGLGFPWAIRLYKKTYTESVSFQGNINLGAIQADFDRKASAFVEGIGEAGEALAEIGDVFGA
jgi:uncharacterized membrane protein YjgN (DUF898 family)